MNAASREVGAIEGAARLVKTHVVGEVSIPRVKPNIVELIANYCLEFVT